MDPRISSNSHVILKSINSKPALYQPHAPLKEPYIPFKKGALGSPLRDVLSGQGVGTEHAKVAGQTAQRPTEVDPSSYHRYADIQIYVYIYISIYRDIRIAV